MYYKWPKKQKNQQIVGCGLLVLRILVFVSKFDSLLKK